MYFHSLLPTSDLAWLINPLLDFLHPVDEQSSLLRMLFCQASQTLASNLGLEGFGAQIDGGRWGLVM